MKRVITVMAVISVAASSMSAAAKSEAPGESLTELAAHHSYRLSYDDGVFSGPGWQRLVDDGSQAQLFLIGEEHGIAENPLLAAQLFESLAAHGYRRLAIEISPPVASLLDQAAAAGGLDGLRALYSEPGGEPAFFGMAEEAQMLARVRAAVPAEQPAFWGLDYEVASDRPLLRQLQQMRKPRRASKALAALTDASQQSWQQYEDTGQVLFIFSFSGDPALVTAVKDAWPDRNGAASRILDTLESTLMINQAWVQGRRWESNLLRANLFRNNWLHHWSDARASGPLPKVVVKLGASHLMRGLSTNATFDLGALLPEVAAIEGQHAVSLLVLPGAGSQTAVLNPGDWSYSAKPAKDGYARGLDTLIAAADTDTFTLFDLRQLRPRVGARASRYGAEVVRVVHGFDWLLVMSGSTASTELDHD